MVSKKYLLLFQTIFFTVSVLLYIPASFSKEPSTTIPSDQATSRCETVKPFAGISADDLMKIKYTVKYTKFAQDYQGVGYFKMVPQDGPVRSRYWRRYRIILNKISKEIDYKDLVLILGPQNLKGLSVLTWTYCDPEKEQEVWTWIPSLRKVRRLSPAEEANPFMGSDFTTEDIATRKWEDETYRMVGEKTFAGHTCTYHEKNVNKDTDCYVIEAKPTREKWYYSKRIVWLNKQFGGLIFDEFFDPEGKRWKTILKEYEVLQDGCIPQVFIEAEDQISNHKTVIGFKKEDITFNNGLQEGFFSEKTLMRSKW
jgi:hypothetical protein